MTENDTTAAVEAPQPSAAKLREFAADNGIEVGSRGTIAQSLKDAFAKAPKRTQKKYL